MFISNECCMTHSLLSGSREIYIDQRGLFTSFRTIGRWAGPAHGLQICVSHRFQCFYVIVGLYWGSCVVLGLVMYGRIRLKLVDQGSTLYRLMIDLRRI